MNGALKQPLEIKLNQNNHYGNPENESESLKIKTADEKIKHELNEMMN